MRKGNFQKYPTAIIFIQIFSVFVIIPTLFIAIIYIFMPKYIAPNLVPKLAKDPKNIRANGCLRYIGKWKSHLDLYSVNEKTENEMKYLIIRNSPFSNKWGSYDKDFRLNFNLNYTSKCLKVKYITLNLGFISHDYVYDIDD